MKDKLYITFLPTYVPGQNSDTENEMIIEGIFKAGDAIMRILTIDPLLAGIYTAFTNDGSSGTLTISKNGGSYAAFSSPYVLEVGDTIQVQRTTDTADGYFKLSGAISSKILGFEFGAGVLVSDEFTIDSSSAGTYTDIYEDGTNGTITMSINAGTPAAFSNPLTLNIGDSIQVIRTISTSDSTIRIYGN